MKTFIFFLALFISVIDIVSFVGAMLESAINKTNTNYRYSILALIMACSLWTYFYHLSL